MNDIEIDVIEAATLPKIWPVYKVIGGLCTTRLDFNTCSKVRASHQLLSLEIKPFTFIEKNYRGQTII